MVNDMFAVMDQPLAAEQIASMHNNSAEVAWVEANEPGPPRPAVDHVGSQRKVERWTWWNIDLSWVRDDCEEHDPLKNKSLGGNTSATGLVMDWLAHDVGVAGHQQ